MSYSGLEICGRKPNIKVLSLGWGLSVGTVWLFDTLKLEVDVIGIATDPTRAESR